MKKLLSLTLALAIIICAVPLGTFTFTASAATEYTDGYYTYTVSNGEATITDVSTSISGNVVIPSTLGGYSVTSIGNSAFSGCTGLTSVIIPNSVRSIGRSAFYGCTGLTSITIGEGVVSIGAEAFAWCEKLTTVNYNATNCAGCDPIVRVFGGSPITTVNIGNNVKNIPDYVFYQCSNLISVTIPNDATSIGVGAFWLCTSLTNITIPGSVTSIGNCAFSSCESLTSITIPDGVTSIGYSAFSECTSLTSVTIGDGVTSIGDYAFRGCNSLTSVTIGDSVTSIGDYAFYNCSGLTSITIPASVKSMGVYACGHCENIYISDIAAWCSIDIYATSDPTSFYGAYTEHNLYLNGELVEHLVIPEDVTSIGNYAFYKCMSLKSVVIPESVEKVGICAFWGSSLEKISVESQEPFEFDAWSFYFLDNITDIFYKSYSSWEYFTSSSFFEGTVSHYNTCKYTNHIYPSDCANGCNICDWTREANGEHTYSSRCDTKCDGCERSRYTDVAHTYINAIDVSCELCGEVRCVETWLIETGKTGIYDIKPNKALNGFTKDSISVFDKNDNLVKYNDEKQGWPLVGGQEYKVVLNDEFNYYNLYWNLVEKSQTIFPDTSSGAWYNDSVTYAVGAGIMSGYSNGKFGTSDSIQRQDFLVMLARLDGVNLDNYKYKSSFPDVARNSYYEAAVNWGAENGIVTGYQNGKFGVGDKVTREQLVTFLYRYADYKGYDTSYSNNRENVVASQYKDYSRVSSFAKEPILWAIEKGVISGKTTTTIVPQGNAQRCEVAKIMYNIYLNDIFN